MDLEAGGQALRRISSVNVILGKNGCGKSTLLKRIEENLGGEAVGKKMYVTPERGGTLLYQPNVDNNMSTDGSWLPQTRRANQFAQFREQSMAQFRQLELSASRLAEREERVLKFQQYIDQINTLLDRIEVYREENDLRMRSKPDGDPRGPEALSSGEAELISLAIELLAFALTLDTAKLNVLLFDSPDVHLHPDLQGRLMGFLTDLVDQYKFRAIVATHSTAVLGGLNGYPGARVAFMQSGDTELEFSEVGGVHRDVLPVFGAHPLSNVFNDVPVLIVEGDDDVRIWQQAVKSSGGAIRLYPVACGSVDWMNDYELKVQAIVSSVYDDPKAYSLRDRDEDPEEINDLPPVTRMRLSCRAAENLLLSNEVLASVGTDWETVKQEISEWGDTNTEHARHAEMRAFKDQGFLRKTADLKELRMLLTGVILASDKPWEVLVGQAIAQLESGDPAPEGSLAEFLGETAMRELIP